jgi:hypothetical protein
MVAPICWVSGLLFVFDFQGRSFNLANFNNPVITASGTVNGSALNEQVSSVSSMQTSRRLTAHKFAQLSFIPINAAETEFIIQFPLSEPVGLSWANSNSGSPLEFIQTFAEPGGGNFELICSGTSARYVLCPCIVRGAI